MPCLNKECINSKHLQKFIVAHYRNEHAKYPALRSCKTDQKYEPSQLIITDPVAEKLPNDDIHHFVVYKAPNFCSCFEPVLRGIIQQRAEHAS